MMPTVRSLRHLSGILAYAQEIERAAPEGDAKECAKHIQALCALTASEFAALFPEGGR